MMSTEPLVVVKNIRYKMMLASLMTMRSSIIPVPNQSGLVQRLDAEGLLPSKW